MHKEPNFLDQTIEASKRAFVYVLIFSFASNVLMLALPIYSLQVLDRVLSSGSMNTLFYLSFIMISVFCVLGAFQIARGLTLVRIGEWFDNRMSKELLSRSLATSAVTPGALSTISLRDMATLKNFISGPGLTAIFDAPWSIIYLIVVFVISAPLGFISLAGCVLLFFVGILNEKAVNGALGKANELGAKTMNQVETSARNAEVIEAMGMTNAIVDKWYNGNLELLAFQTLASNRSSVITSVARSLRMILQIILMGTGAVLAVGGELTVGGMIACSIITGRALAPFEMAIGAWKNVTDARKSYQRLQKFIDVAPVRKSSIQLPVPKGNLSVTKLLFPVPGTNRPIINGIGFNIAAGDILGIIGPSASGKSTLAKLLMGVYKPLSGNVRLDGADVYTWDREDFGKHTGYLPQDIELFSGNVSDNISRMRQDATDEDIISAAKISGTHDMILHLPNGYETDIGPGGVNLSAGQRQRIGLARAFFGNPKFLVLDEPNSNLDEAGEIALVHAIKNAKALKITTVIIAHRITVLNYVDHIMMMKDGSIADFGAAKDILAKYMRQAPAQVQQKPQQISQKKTSQPNSDVKGNKEQENSVNV